MLLILQPEGSDWVKLCESETRKERNRRSHMLIVFRVFCEPNHCCTGDHHGADAVKCTLHSTAELSKGGTGSLNVWNDGQWLLALTLTLTWRFGSRVGWDPFPLYDNENVIKYFCDLGWRLLSVSYLPTNTKWYAYPLHPGHGQRRNQDFLGEIWELLVTSSASFSED